MSLSVNCLFHIWKLLVPYLEIYGKKITDFSQKSVDKNNQICYDTEWNYIFYLYHIYSQYMKLRFVPIPKLVTRKRVHF